MKKIKLIIAAASLVAMTACEGGKTAADNARGCVSAKQVSGGAEYTNKCDFQINMAVFNPIFRFILSANETEFLARSENLEYAACKAPSKPKELDGKFICD